MNAKKLTVLTPCAETRLVARESGAAFTTLGHTVAEVASITPQDIATIFARPPEASGLAAHPDIFFCVNFHGLDKYGEAYEAFRKRGIPVAVWCVDNPWNLVAGIRGDFWKDLHLFVTDISFVPELHAQGARHVHHLPLAADTTRFAPGAPSPTPALQPVVFVGRSAFPDKERYFLGQSVPAELEEKAARMIAHGERPDFAWWQRELFPDGTPDMGSGSAARRVSLGAENASLLWRNTCLSAARESGLTVFGDAGWRDMLPAGTDIRHPIDYYTRLPGVYEHAPFSLVATSLLLPHGLNQRHFDVWAAGGFALLDATPGLSLFPEELTRAVTFQTPQEIPAIVSAFTNAPEKKNRLAQAWRNLVLAEHTYKKRIKNLLTRIFS